MSHVARFAPLLACAAALHIAQSPNNSLPEQRISGPETLHCRVRKRGTAADNDMIIGGVPVQDPNKYPFLAWIGDNDGSGMKQFCGGSLISSRVVLTAAHCVYENDISNANVYIRFKLADFSQEPGLAYSVINWQRHEGYSRYPIKDDIALWLLNESVSDEVPRLPLSDGTQDYEKSGDKVLAGWGSTDEGCVVYGTILRETTIPMGAYGPTCSTPGSKELTENEHFDPVADICAGFYEMPEQTYPGCGDSGGPLLHKGENGYVQVGFVDWSYGFPYPDVYGRVSHHLPWIWETAAKLEALGPHEAVKAQST